MRQSLMRQPFFKILIFFYMCIEDVNVKKEEEIKDTNNSSSEGEEKDLKAKVFGVSKISHIN